MSDPLDTLLSHPAIWRASHFLTAQECQQQAVHGTSTGYARLDRELPDGGWPQSGVLELLLAHAGLGEMSLMIPALAHLSQQNRVVAWVSPPWMPYAPALAQRGVKLDQVLLVRPTHLRDCLWAMEQCLSSGACAAVLGWPQALQPQQIKRLHMAAQYGKCLGVLMRHRRHGQNASPAPLRIEIGTQTLLPNAQMQCELRIIKRRGRWPSDWFPVYWKSPLVPQWPVITPLYDTDAEATVIKTSDVKTADVNATQAAAPPSSGTTDEGQSPRLRHRNTAVQTNDLA